MYTPIYGIFQLDPTGIYGIVWVLYIMDYKPLTKWVSGMCICTLLLEFLFLPADVE